MKLDAIAKIEEKIRRDGSLSEERKVELLRLLTTMNPEESELQKSQGEYAKGMVLFSKIQSKNPLK